MKKLIYAIVATGLLAFGSCKKEDKKNYSGQQTPLPDSVKKSQNPVLIYFVTTWFCTDGSCWKPMMGKNAFISTQYPDALIIACHMNSANLNDSLDPFSCKSANDLGAAFQLDYAPKVFIGGGSTSFSGYSTSTYYYINEVKADFNSRKAIAPTAQSDFVDSISGNKLYINTLTEFYKDLPDDYFLSVHSTEDRLSAKQVCDQSGVDRFIHDNVLRLNVTSNVYGDLVKSAPKKGLAKRTFMATLDSNWNKSNLKVNLALWRKAADGTLTICNGFKRKM